MRVMPRPSVLRRQRGFTLVELLVALLIGLFLLGGLMTLVQDNQRTFNTQSSLAQLQDGERLAMSIMTDVIQTAGYYPTPQLITPAKALPAATVAGTAWGSLQAVYGVDGTGSNGDTVSVRYETLSGDGILSCNGTTNSSGAPYLYYNTFSVNALTNQLVCTRGDLASPGNVFPLVSNVTSLQVLYGVNSAGTGNTVDTYMTATQVSAAGRWDNVISVQLQLTFINPLCASNYGGQTSCFAASGSTATANNGQKPTITFQRTVPIMGGI